MSRRHIFFASLMILWLPACRSTTPKVESGDEKKISSNLPDETRLTQQGRNSQPRFSPTGEQLLFVSEQRPQHKHPQIYGMTLKNNKERRITYQDGVNASPVFHPNGSHFYYASSTDEEKENSPYIRRVLAEMNGKAPTSSPLTEEPATEIYLSHINGHSIERLSRRPGFDGHPSPIGSSESLVVTTSKDGKLTLAKLTKGKLVVLVSDQADHFQPSVSPKGTDLVWVRRANDGGSPKIMVGDIAGKNARPLLNSKASQVDPVWHSDSEHILFSSDEMDKNFEIFVVKKDGTCLHRLTKSPEADRQPALSPRGDRLVFSRQTAESSHLIMKSLTLPQGCSEKTIE